MIKNIIFGGIALVFINLIFNISAISKLEKIYDNALKEYVTIQPSINGLNHNYHKYVVRFQNKEVRDRVKAKIGQIHYDKPISDNIMYQDIDLNYR